MAAQNVKEIIKQIQDRDSYYAGILVKNVSVQIERFRTKVEGMRYKSSKMADVDNLEDTDKLRRAIILLLYQRISFSTIEEEGNRIEWRIRFVKGVLPKRLIDEIERTSNGFPLVRVRNFSELNQQRNYLRAEARMALENQAALSS